LCPLRLREARAWAAIERLADKQTELDGVIVTLTEAQIKLQEGQVRLQEGQAGLQEGQARLQEAQIKTEERFRETGERIDNLVSAIGKMLRNGGTPL